MFLSSERLTPECQQAVGVLEGVLRVEALNVTKEIPSIEVVCSEGHLSVHEGAISTSQLPREEDWIWNQSRGKKTLTSPSGDKEASFFKLNTRSRNQEAPPAIKLWVFNVQLLPSGRTLGILWCEKSDRKRSTSNLSTSTDPHAFPPVEGDAPMSDLFDPDFPLSLDLLWNFDPPNDYGTC